MPTVAERNALMFVAVVALVGAGVQLSGTQRFERDLNAASGAVRADTGGPVTRALVAQLAAVDSARAAGPRRNARTRRRNAAAADSVRVRPRRPARGTSRGDDSRVGRDGAESPGRGEGPDRHEARPRSGRRSGSIPDRTVTPPAPSPDAPLDINAATAEELERLPRIGPALARRIVEWRNRHGSFGSVDDLRHVAGIGPATASVLAPLVTFSGGYRPFHSETRSARTARSPLER